MNLSPGLEVPPLFRCASDTPDAPLLGYHDGISSWTLNAAADPDGLRQAFVSHHERAHHQLHAGSAWGTAMLVTGLADENGQVAADLWQDLARACLETHEAYATFAAVAQVRDGLDVLVGNLRYLQYLRRAHVIADVFDNQVADAGLHLIMHLLMTPQALLDLGPDDLRRPGTVEQLIRDHAPDQRFAALRRQLADDALRDSLRELIPAEDAVMDIGAVCALLTGAGIDTPEPDAVSTWITGTIEVLRPMHPGLIAEPLGTSDRLTSLLDDQQRERVQMHHDVLPLRQIVPADDGSFPVAQFARTAPDLGAHLWLAWLHPGFLRRQFDTGDQALGEKSSLGLLACDRTHGDPHASRLTWPSVPPGPAAHSLRRSGHPVTPLLFSTWRSLDSTPDGVDFRGFEPAFVLIDGNVLAFLQKTVASDGQAKWSVVGTSGDRTIDVLAIEEQRVKGVISLLVCSSPTGKLVTNWMRQHPHTFQHDTGAFQPLRPQLWALTKHLLGTFWIFDLHGWDPTEQDTPPVSR
ncbi:hypothetical protein ACGFJ7_35605 [Actinoplanes sp. NPDC048988]|uniref:hypothetical protein n=1 Tax=Actinoplanes sp. NPDC048988 TaxID=3363901 RepID=UPI00371AD7DA